MTSDMPELDTLAFHWADAYLLSYSRDRWVALRRDTRRFLIAGTLTGLEHAIQADYRHNPVSRDCDPPGTAGYLSLPGDGDVAGDGDVPDEESRFILAALRYAFPVVDHHLLAPAAGLDRPQPRKNHLPELPGAAVRRADPDRAQATVRQARPRSVNALGMPGAAMTGTAGTRRHRPVGLVQPLTSPLLAPGGRDGHVWRSAR